MAVGATIPIFIQGVKSLPQRIIDGAVAAHNTDCRSKGCSHRDAIQAMLFAQISNSRSLRDVCFGLTAANLKGYVTQSGMRVLSRSSLDYINEHRDYRV